MGKHAAMSMTKSITGLLAEILVVEGQLDDKAKVSSIIPELKGQRIWQRDCAPGHGHDHGS
jgi:CubicO group peptidase (beta-lactamase class C family)